MTKNARYILEIINNSTEHLTAEHIYLRLQHQNENVVLATVYNNLASLHEKGLIRKITVDGCPDRYDKPLRHDHLVCRKCKKILDITLEDLTEKLQEQINIPMLSYDLKINYICEECIKKENKENGGDQA